MVPTLGTGTKPLRTRPLYNIGGGGAGDKQPVAMASPSKRVKTNHDEAKSDEPPKPPQPMDVPVRWDLWKSDNAGALCDPKRCRRCKKGEVAEPREWYKEGDVPSISFTFFDYDAEERTIHNPLDDPILRQLGVSEKAIRAAAQTVGLRFSDNYDCETRQRQPELSRSLLLQLFGYGRTLPTGENGAYAPLTPQESALKEWYTAKDKYYCGSRDIVAYWRKNGTIEFNGPWPGGLAWKTIPRPKNWVVRRKNIIELV